MEGLPDVNWGDVFRALKGNPLGLVALVVIVLGIVAVKFFRSDSKAVRLSVFGALFLGSVGLIAVIFHEHQDLEQTVERARELTKLAAGVDGELAALEKPGAQDADARTGAVLANTAMLSDFVEASPALQQQPRANAAQLRLEPKRAGMLPRKDPHTGRPGPGPQPLDADTKAAAQELSRAVVASLKGKDPLELRELLREKPGG